MKTIPISDPRIFVEVVRKCGDDDFIKSRKEISFIEWQTAIDRGTISRYVIDEALDEVSQFVGKIVEEE